MAHPARRGIRLDSIILGELSFGILDLPKGRKRAQLEQWFETVGNTIECLASMPPLVSAGLDWYAI
jgi:hypothetical protein